MADASIKGRLHKTKGCMHVFNHCVHPPFKVMISSSPPSLPSSTCCIDPICAPISKVSEAPIAQSNAINTTVVSIPTTPELESSGPLWQHYAFSPVIDIGEGQLSDSDEYASDSGVSEGQSDHASSLVSTYLEPEWYGSLPYAPRSNYPFPCSDDELLEREPLRYLAIKLLREQYGMSPLHLAPINRHPHKILDIGTGTGLWANDGLYSSMLRGKDPTYSRSYVAEVYASAEVEGIDVNAIALSKFDHFTNVTFTQDDIEKDWMLKRNSLDFVHAGLVLNSIEDIPRLLGQAWNSLKPGGWLEVVDFHYLPHHAEDGSIVRNGNSEFHQRLTEAMAKQNFDLHTVTTVANKLDSAGFINIRERVLKMPIGSWHDDPELKEIGKIFRLVIKKAIPEIGMRAIQENLGWSWEQMIVLGGKAKESLDLPFRTYFPLHIVIARKPA